MIFSGAADSLIHVLRTYKDDNSISGLALHSLLLLIPQVMHQFSCKLYVYIFLLSVLLIAFPLLSVLCKQFQEAERKRFKKERLKDLLLEIQTSPGQHHKVIGKLLCMKKIS
jgi:hypothetical protein